jgi:EpsI family protein
VAAVAVALLSAVWPLGFQALGRGIATTTAPRLSPLGAAGAWQAAPGRLSSWQPSFQAPSSELVQTFAKDGQRVGLYIGFYRNQSASRKLVSSENVLVRSSDSAWTRVAGGVRPVKIGNQIIDAATAELRGANGERLVVWKWYWIGGRITANDYWAAGYIALSRLLAQSDDSAAIVVYAPEDRPGDADAALEAFVRDAGPALDATLASVRVQQ